MEWSGLMDLILDYGSKKFRHKFLLIINFLMTYALMYLIIDLFEFEKYVEGFFLLVLLITLAVYFFNKVIVPLLVGLQLFWIIAIVVEMLSVNFSLLNYFGAKKYVLTLNYLFFYRNLITIEAGYEGQFIFWCALLVSIVLLYFMESRFNWRYLLLGQMVIVLSWFFYVENLETYFTLYLIGMIIYRQYYLHQKNKSDVLLEENYLKIIYGLLFTLVLIFIASKVAIVYFPNDEINEKLNMIIPQSSLIRSEYKGIKSYGYYTLEGSMYQKRVNVLGGPIEEVEKDLLFLVDGFSGLYLRGRVKDEYTGHNWVNNETTYKNNQAFIDTIQNDNLKKITIYPKKIKTVTLFSPYVFYKSAFDSKYIYMNSNYSVFYKGPANKALTDEYTVWYTKHTNEQLEDATMYLQVPEENLEYTRQLVEKLTATLETPEEKIKEIYSYLRNNEEFSYDLNVDESIVYKDFVENFLKNQKKGYCTYYASALAVMGRLAEVPTRYVEGFKLPKRKNDEGLYEVTADRAHAWVEVYLPERGWITLDPTPLYDGGSTEISDELTIEEIMESFEGREGVAQMKEDSLDPSIVNGESKSAGIWTVQWLVWIVLAVGGILIVGFFFRRTSYDEEQVEVWIHKFLLLSSNLLERDLSEDTFMQIYENVVQYLEMKPPGVIKNIFNKYLYSPHVLTSKEVLALEEFHREFLEKSKRKLGKVPFWVTLYIKK